MKTITMLRDRAWLLGLAYLVLLAASKFRSTGHPDTLFLTNNQESEQQ